MSDLQTLPTWLDAGAAALAGATPPAQTLVAALPGLTQAQSLTPAQRVQRVQASGLAECGRAGEPLYLAWREFLRGHGSSAKGSSTLVIDATDFDMRALGSAAVLESASWLLAEGLLIAASLRDSRKVELRLPAGLTGHEAAFLNTAEAIQRLKQASVPHIQLAVLRNSRPSCWGEGRASDRSRLIHTPETWCRIALLFAAAFRHSAEPRCVVADATGRHDGARPGRVGPFGEPAAAGRGLGRRRGAGQRCDARLRRWDGRLPATLRSGSIMRAAVILGRSDYAGAVHPVGDGRQRLCRQADPSCALSPLATRRGRGCVCAAVCWCAPRAW